MKALPKGANVHVLIADFPRGERNQNLTKKIPFSVHFMVYPVARRHSVLPRSGGTSTPKIVMGQVTKFRFTGLVISRVSVTKKNTAFGNDDNHLRNLYC